MRTLREPAVIDLVVAVALTLSSQLEIWAPGLALGAEDVEGSRPVLSGTAAVMTAALAVRRAQPLLCVSLVLGAGCLQALLTTPADGLSSLITVVLAVYSAGAARGRRPALGAAAWSLVYSPVTGADAADDAFVLLVLGAALAAGLLVRRRTARIEQLLVEARDLERRRLEAASQGAAEERARIARELHDVVAHRVSMIVVQAQASAALLDRDPDAARRSLDAIDDAGRQALVELRAMLGLLRDDDDEARRAPLPGLDGLELLVEQARTSGLPVELHLEGEPAHVPPAVSLAAYRIVQEGLTNVVKHAGSAPTRVVVRCLDEAVEVDVTDEGVVSADQPGRGFGLAGMRERAAFLGGTFESGRHRDGGFQVRARLPVAKGMT